MELFVEFWVILDDVVGFVGIFEDLFLVCDDVVGEFALDDFDAVDFLWGVDSFEVGTESDDVIILILGDTEADLIIRVHFPELLLDFSGLFEGCHVCFLLFRCQ